MKSKIVKL